MVRVIGGLIRQVQRGGVGNGSPICNPASTSSKASRGPCRRLAISKLPSGSVRLSAAIEALAEPWRQTAPVRVWATKSLAWIHGVVGTADAAQLDAACRASRRASPRRPDRRTSGPPGAAPSSDRDARRSIRSRERLRVAVKEGGEHPEMVDVAHPRPHPRAGP